MKNLIHLTVFVLISMIACTSKKSEKTEESPSEEIQVSLEKVWETDTVLSTPESSLYDKKNNVVYVSCIAGVPPDARDNDGFIAKISPQDGSIIELQWVTGLDAPKGLGLYDSTLYVTDIDEVVAISTMDGSISGRYPVDSARFLNDITVDTEGNVYFSDSGAGKVYKLSNGEVSLWADVSGGPNGLYYDGEKMMVATFGSGDFNEIDLITQEVKPVVDSIPGGDGVVKVGEDFLVSNWNGEVYYITSDYTKKKILDTKDAGANAADISFIADSNLLLVPTFFGNQIVAYKLTK